MKCESVLLVNMHATALIIAPFALGKNFRTQPLNACSPPHHYMSR